MFGKLSLFIRTLKIVLFVTCPALQVDRFWWITASGAYGMHGEMLYQCPYWSNSYGKYCGQVCDHHALSSYLPT